MRVAAANGARIDWLPVAAIALAIGLVAFYALSSGSWLDEYWQLYISGAPAAELTRRLLADAHPPWFNLLVRPLLAISDGEVVAARLISLAGALALLGAGLRALHGLEHGMRWRIFLLAVASAGPAGMTELGASFRVYPWLLALAVLQSTLLLLVAGRRPAPAAMTIAVTAASIALHYVHAAGAIAIALVTAYLAWRNRDRRMQALVVIGVVIGCALDLVTGLTQLPQWRANLDTNWIAVSGGGAGIIAQGLADFLLYNLIAAILLGLGLARSRGRASWLWLLAPLPIAFVAWLAMNMVIPLLVARYLAAATALLLVAAAAAWQSLALTRAAHVALALLAALQPLFYLVVRPPLPGWEAGAAAAAPLVRACPSSPLFAVSAWRFRDRPDSRMAAFEEPVFRLAYVQIGARFGLHPRFVDRPLALPSAPCPSIVWAEAAHGLDQASPAAVLRRARLTAPAGAMARFVATPNGALLVVTPKPIPNSQLFALQEAHGRP